jgi:hypothetical protein
MSSFSNRVNRLEARSRSGNCPTAVKVFDPLKMDDVEKEIAEAERMAMANGQQLFAIRIVDPWRNGGTEHEEH